MCLSLTKWTQGEQEETAWYACVNAWDMQKETWRQNESKCAPGVGLPRTAASSLACDDGAQIWVLQSSSFLSLKRKALFINGNSEKKSFLSRTPGFPQLFWIASSRKEGSLKMPAGRDFKDLSFLVESWANTSALCWISVTLLFLFRSLSFVSFSNLLAIS